jgi:hypothetical protein
MTDPKYKNDFLGSLHETAEGLHTIGVITGTELRKYDRSCLVRQDTAPPAGTAPRSQPGTPAYAGEHN